MRFCRKAEVVCLLLPFFWQCSPPPPPPEIIAFAEKDTIALFVDSTSLNVYQSLQLYTDTTNDRDYLVALNEHLNSLDFYSLNTEVLASRIIMDREGPNGVGKGKGFHISSMDSIYVLYMQGYQLSLIDSTGNVLASYKLLNGDLDSITSMPEQSGTALPRLSTYSPMLEVGGTLIMNSFPDRNPYFMDFFETKELLLYYNTKKDTVHYNLGYPEAYKDGLWGMGLLFHFSVYDEKRKTLLLSFAVDDYIYEANLDGEITNRYLAKSRQIDDRASSVTDVSDSQDNVTHFLTSPSYGGIIYDKHHDLYYRLAAVPMDEDDIDWSYLPGNVRSHYVIIMNNKFDYLGEMFLPSERYNPNMSFVRENGVYFALNSTSEDTMSFVLFDPQLE